MTPEIRSIVPDELLDWVETLHVVFHADEPAAEEAAYRRDVLDQDLGRTLAAVDTERGAHRVAGTLFSYPAELTLPGGTCLIADAVTAITVLPTHRRRGLLTRLLGTDLRAARERGEPAAILIAAEYPIYGRFGFGPATEQATYTVATAVAEFRRSPDGAVDFLPPAEMREVAPRIFDQFRRRRPGQIDRQLARWDTRLGLRESPWGRPDHPLRCAVFTDPQRDIQGYLLYRVDGTWDRRLPTGKLEVVELMALTPDAYLGLWRYCCEVDLVAEVTAGMRCIDEPLPWLLHNPRAALPRTQRADLLWLRPLDVPATLAARRYASAGRLVIEVSDPLNLCAGRFVIEGSPDGATCRPTDASADLRMGIAALGSLVLGGANLHVMAEAGAIDEQRPGALAAADALFHWPVTPWCSTFF
ncbi:MAG TPA: GNAT family N-acetyltransferase [Chloroflexota bacterium]|nr:GNAT family N-acetyltransferase [Chloroflexota bacterium]